VLHWLSRFALLLYLTVLCTPQAFAVHDTRLSPLADSQFHAVAPAEQSSVTKTEQDSVDEPQPALPRSTIVELQPAGINTTAVDAPSGTPAFLFAQQARAPPQLLCS
jgi:hypothetical protein